VGVLHERSRKTIGFGGKRLPGNLKHNGQKGAKGRQLPNRAGRRFSSYRGRWGWAATFGAGMCGEEDSSAVRRRNDKTMGLRVYRLQICVRCWISKNSPHRKNLALVVELTCESILSGS